MSMRDGQEVREFGAIQASCIEDGHFDLLYDRLYCCSSRLTYPQPSWDMEWSDDYQPPTVAELDRLKAELEAQLILVEQVRTRIICAQAAAADDKWAEEMAAKHG